MYKKILITGINGFIGKNLFKNLLIEENKFKEIIFIFIGSKPINHKPKKNFIFLNYRIEDLNVDDEIFDSIDLVLHMAAKVDYFGAKNQMKSNHHATQKLIKLCKNKNIKNMIYLSTLGAIDRPKWSKCNYPISEDDMCFATSWYGRYKFMDEELIRNSNFNYLILRIPWVFGMGMNKSHHLMKLSLIASKFKVITKIPFPGKISLLAVSNLTSYLIDIFKTYKIEKKIVHLSDKTISFYQLFNYLATDKSLKIIENEYNNDLKILKYLFYFIRGFMPFQFRCLIYDVLVTNSSKDYSQHSKIEVKEVKFFSDFLSLKKDFLKSINL